MSPGWQQRGERWSIAALAALTALLFHKLIFGGQVLIERDIGIWWYGRIEAFVRSVTSGSWPLWDPHTAFGKPLLASPGEQILYPWTWISLLVWPGSFITIYVVGHLLFSGVGLFALGRRLGLSPAAALLSGALWIASGPLLSFVNILHFGGASWIPWVLLATHSAFTAPSVARAVALGAAMAVQMLAGSVDMCAMTGLLAAVYAVRFFEWRALASPSNRRLLACGCGAVAFAACLAAAQWLPAVAVLRGSGRTALAESVRAYWSLHPWSLAQTLIPALPQSLPLAPWVKSLLFDGDEPLVYSVYLGLAAVPLVAAARIGPLRALAAQLVALGVVATLYALGRYTFVHGVLVTVLPPLAVLRYPSKATVLLAFAWSLLAGLGLDAWRAREASWDRRARLAVLTPTILAISAVLVVLGVVLIRAESLGALFLEPSQRGPLAAVLSPTAERLAWAGLLGVAALALTLLRAWRPRVAMSSAAVLGGLAVLDLVLAHQGLNPSAPRALVERPPPSVGLVEREGPTRIYAFDYGPRLRGQSYRRPAMEDPFELAPGSAADPRVEKALGLQSYLFYTAATRWGLSSGFGADLQGTAPRHITNLNLVMWASQETPEFLRLLRIASVSSVIALHTEGLEELQPRAVVPGPFAREIRVFSVPEPLPRTYAVGGVRVADGLAAYKTLVDPGFDPKREVVLAAGAPVPAPASFGGTSTLRAYLSDRVQIEAVLDQPGFVVLVDAYDPDWRATVDGVETPVLRANVAFRAVAVPAGRHLVELRYRPGSVPRGLALSAAALLVGLLVAARSLRSARGRAEPPAA